MPRSSSPSDAKQQRRRNKELKEFYDQYSLGRTNVVIGNLANVSPSTISMVLGGSRTASPHLIRKLAKVLCPPGTPLEEFTREMLQRAGHSDAIVLASDESVVERMKRELRVAYVENEPFVGKKFSGFASELFNAVVSLIDANITVQRYYPIRDIRRVLERGEADIVVSAILPTYQRSTYMSFSNPFPYLRVPLSALVRTGTQVKPGEPLGVEQLLGWTADRQGLQKIKMLLVEEEVGHDFVTKFLKASGKHYTTIDTLEPEALWDELAEKPELNLLLADMATCAGVYRLAEETRANLKSSQKMFEPLSDTELGKFIRQTLTIRKHRGFPVLALYPITFGIPKHDTAWKDTINLALDHLKTEGMRVLLSLYDRYLTMEGGNFLDFCVKEDEFIASKTLHEVFLELFRSHGNENDHTSSDPQDEPSQ